MTNQHSPANTHATNERLDVHSTTGPKFNSESEMMNTQSGLTKFDLDVAEDGIYDLRELTIWSALALDDVPAAHIFVDIMMGLDRALMFLLRERAELAGDELCEVAATLPLLIENDRDPGKRFFGLVSRALAAKIDSLGVKLGGASQITGEKRRSIYADFALSADNREGADDSFGGKVETTEGLKAAA